MRGAAFGRKREQGDARFDVQQMARELGGGDGNFRQLFMAELFYTVLS
jgi:hypothetical protein